MMAAAVIPDPALVVLVGPMRDGMELMRLLVQAHLDLRSLREARRDDVTDAAGDVRRTCEDGQERGRVMIFGDVRTSRIAYRKRGKENLYPQDAELNWGPRCYSAGVQKRLAEAIALVPAERAAAQVSRQGAVTAGKRQAEENAVAVTADFDRLEYSVLPDVSVRDRKIADRQERDLTGPPARSAVDLAVDDRRLGQAGGLDQLGR
jgi:hypothetical protein